MWPANKAIETAGITSLVYNGKGIFGAAAFNNNKLHGPSKYHGKQQ
jgi:hypothetical protein